jgi:predicted PurR-regulated permease PerM
MTAEKAIYICRVMTKNTEPAPVDIDKKEVASYILATAALAAVLTYKILAALIAGLLVNQIIHTLSSRLHIGRLRGKNAKLTAIAIVTTVVLALITLLTYGTSHYISNSNGNISNLFNQMAKIIEEAHDILPESFDEILPDNTTEMRSNMSSWLRQHSAELQTIGAHTGRVAAQVIIGIVIGAMVALREAMPRHSYKPLAGALAARSQVMAESFKSVVFAQIRIATINATLTGIYLAAVLPSMGIHLPFVKIMIFLTFILGLLPIVGNIMSNTIIVVVSLSHSLHIALASLAFLIIIHKLEYFLNAHIVGTRIKAHAWELLCAMLIMEAAFGIQGLIAAPFYYAYLKNELSLQKMI